MPLGGRGVLAGTLRPSKIGGGIVVGSGPHAYFRFSFAIIGVSILVCGRYICQVLCKRVGL